MSYLSRLKKKVGFEHSVPRCDICRHFEQGGKVMVNSIPRKKPSTCGKHGFVLIGHSICNDWIEKRTGAQLLQEGTNALQP